MAKPLIVENTEDGDVWNVYPTPGMCIKFRDVISTFFNYFNHNCLQTAFPNVLITSTALSNKFFVNLAHCIEMPPPKKLLDEDTVAHLIETDPDGFKIPICIGELETVDDHNGDPVTKVCSCFQIYLLVYTAYTACFRLMCSLIQISSKNQLMSRNFSNNLLCA